MSTILNLFQRMGFAFLSAVVIGIMLAMPLPVEAQVTYTEYRRDLDTWTRDSAIQESIRKQFIFSPFVNNHLDITVRNGVATITGNVKSYREADAAINNAFQGGAKQVVVGLIIDHIEYYYDNLTF